MKASRILCVAVAAMSVVVGTGASASQSPPTPQSRTHHSESRQNLHAIWVSYIDSPWLLAHYSSQDQAYLRSIAQDFATVYSYDNNADRAKAAKALSAPRRARLMRLFEEPQFSSAVCGLPFDLPPPNVSNIEDLARVEIVCAGPPPTYESVTVDDGEGQEATVDAEDPTNPDAASTDASSVSLSGMKTKSKCGKFKVLFVTFEWFCIGTTWSWRTPLVTNCYEATPDAGAIYPYGFEGYGPDILNWTPNSGVCHHSAVGTFSGYFATVRIATWTASVHQTLGNNGSSINHAHGP